MQRIILHVDLDYFYAQVEELRYPELKGKPVAVCMFSGRTEYSGAVATANYKARELGVKAGMPIAFARQKSKDIVLLRADREYYEQVSERIMEILRGFSNRFEQVSIDEAYLDVSERAKGDFAEAEKIAREVKNRLMEEEKLTCSIGIGPNKLIAKMVAGTQKPNGLTAVKADEVEKFMRGQEIKDIHGIGPKTVEFLAEKGITSIEQLASTAIPDLREWFGENKGLMIHEKALGIDDDAVEEKPQKQFSRITTLKENTSDPEKIIEEARKLAIELGERAIKEKVFFRTVSITLISNHLEDMTRSKTLPSATQDREKIIEVSTELFRSFFEQHPDFIARRFGLRVSGFEEPKKQKSIFEY